MGNCRSLSSRNSARVMEPNGSLSRSQKHTARPHPKPDEAKGKHKTPHTLIITQLD